MVAHGWRVVASAVGGCIGGLAARGAGAFDERVDACLLGGSLRSSALGAALSRGREGGERFSTAGARLCGPGRGPAGQVGGGGCWPLGAGPVFVGGRGLGLAGRPAALARAREPQARAANEQLRRAESATSHRAHLAGRAAAQAAQSGPGRAEAFAALAAARQRSAQRRTAQAAAEQARIDALIERARTPRR